MVVCLFSFTNFFANKLDLAFMLSGKKNDQLSSRVPFPQEVIFLTAGNINNSVYCQVPEAPLKVDVKST